MPNANPRTDDSINDIPSDEASQRENSFIADLKNQLAKDPSGINGLYHGNYTWVNTAIFIDSPEALKILIDNGADLEALDAYGSTPLLNALLTKRFDMAIILIQDGNVDVNKRPAQSEYPIFFAIRDGDVRMLEVMLNHGGLLHPPGSKFHHLHFCAQHKRVDLAKFLIEHGEDVNDVDSKGHSPLFYAQNNRQIEMVELLEKNGAKLNASENKAAEEAASKPKNPFIEAAMGGDEIVNERIRSQYADFLVGAAPRGQKLTLNEAEFDKWMKLEYEKFKVSIKNKYLKDLDKLAKQNPALINETDKKGNTALHYSIIFTDWMVEFLINHNADVNVRNKMGYSPLLFALQEPRLEVIQQLLKAGADVMLSNNEGKNALQLMSKVPQNVQLLILEKATDINCRDNNGLTPLHMAVDGDNIEIIKLLLANKADVNAVDFRSKTPLLYTYHGEERGISLQVVKLLIENGANVNAKENNGYCLLHHAAILGDLKTLKYLIDHGANVDDQDGHGNTALHLAAHSNNAEIAGFLIDHGANVNAINAGGFTPLQVATQNRSKEVISILSKKGG